MVKIKTLPLPKHTYFQPASDDAKHLINSIVSVENKAVRTSWRQRLGGQVAASHFEAAAWCPPLRGPEGTIWVLSLSHVPDTLVSIMIFII